MIATAPPASGPRRGRNRRWAWITAAVVVVVVLVVAAVLVVPRLRSTPEDATAQPRLTIPGETLLPSLGTQPRPGWRLPVASLIPNHVAPLNISLFGTSGDRAFFEVRDATNVTAWVVGVDVTTGASAFPPVQVAVSGAMTCYANGPQRVVCLNTHPDANSDTADDRVDAWVLDTATGAVLSQAPTELRSGRVDPPLFNVDQIGDYLVASRKGIGWYGIGDTGQPTWHVPGPGGKPSHVVEKSFFPGDPAVNLAANNTDGPGLVFSVVDGTVFTALEQGWIEPVMGGFVVMDEQSPSQFHFYDDRGAKLGDYRPESGVSAEIATGNGQRAVVTISSLSGSDVKQLVFDTKGDVLAEVNSHSLGDGIRFIGRDMYAAPDDIRSESATWNKFDLSTGVAIGSCSGVPLRRVDYVGSDGAVVIGNVPDVVTGTERFVAVDTTTCQRVWELPGRPRVWTVGTTLVQVLDDTGEITSLTPG